VRKAAGLLILDLEEFNRGTWSSDPKRTSGRWARHRFRTIQGQPKDLPGTLRQAAAAVE
jgi:hypothetical protein